MKGIVIIDYDMLSRGILSEYLEIKGYEVNAFGDIKEAIEIIKNCGLIILDYVHAEENTDSFLKILEPYKNIPIIITSAYPSITDDSKWILFGACAIMMKPYPLNEILKNVKKIFES